MTARYRATAVGFIAPHTLKPDDEFETDQEAAEWMEPLNEEAVEAKEAWYNKKVEVKDENDKVIRTVYPNKNKRPAKAGGVDLVSATVSLIKRGDKTEAPIIGVTQERILAGDPAPLEPVGESKKVLKVDDPEAPPAKPKA